jgi:hypothetical protein
VALVLTPLSLPNHWFLLAALIAFALVAGWLSDELTVDQGSSQTACKTAKILRESDLR